MAVRDRLRRLEGDHGPQPCEESYCLRIVATEVIRYADGTENRLGGPPPPECESCPYREGGGPIRWIEVVRQY